MPEDRTVPARHTPVSLAQTGLYSVHLHSHLPKHTLTHTQLTGHTATWLNTATPYSTHVARVSLLVLMVIFCCQPPPPAHYRVKIIFFPVLPCLFRQMFAGSSRRHNGTTWTTNQKTHTASSQDPNFSMREPLIVFYMYLFRSLRKAPSNVDKDHLNLCWQSR